MTSLLSKQLEDELRSDLDQGTIVWNELGIVNRAVYERRLGVTRRALPQSVLSPYDNLGPKRTSTESVLRSLLEQDLDSGSLVFSKPGFIDKRYYARRAGCSNTQYYKELFAEYEARVGAVRTTDALVDLLTHDFEAGTLRFSRGGKIDRTSYAKQLGVTKASLTSHIALFEGFEERLGGSGRYRDQDLEKMAKWLETNFQAGLLRFHKNGRLVRKQFTDAFSITYGDFETRFPSVSRLIREYDGLQQHRFLNAGPRLDTEEPKTGKGHPASSKNIPGSIEPRARSTAMASGRQPEVPEKSAHAFLAPEVVAAFDDALSADAARAEPRFETERSDVERAVASASSALGQFSDWGSIEEADDDESLDLEWNEIAIQMDDHLSSTPQLTRQAIQETSIERAAFRDEIDASEAFMGRNVLKADLVGPLLVYYPALERHQNYDSGSLSADLVLALNELVLGRGLPRWEDGTLNRAKLARLFGVGRWEVVSHDTILLDYDIATRPPSGSNIFDDHRSNELLNHPLLAAHRAYPAGSAFGRAVKILDRLCGEKQGLPRTADGSLNMDFLARELEINPKAISTYQFIIEDYDRFDKEWASANLFTGNVPPIEPEKCDAELPLASFGLAVQSESLSPETTIIDSDEQADRPEVVGNSSAVEPIVPVEPAVVVTSATPMCREPLSKHPGLRRHQFYEVGSTRQRLVEILNRHFDREPYAPLVQRELADALDVSESAISAGYLDVIHDYRSCANGSARQIGKPVDSDLVARYPEIEKHQYHDPDSTRGRLVSILNDGLRSGSIPRSRGGKIDRRALCTKFGLSITGMANYLDILRDYESATGGLQNVHARRIPEMEAFLAAALKEGTLEVRDDRVERRQFFRHFGLTENKTILVRNPGILALLERYDDLVKSTGYLPNRIRQEMDVLSAALADDPPICKTGLSVDRTSISKTTKISLGRIVRSPFAEILEEADARLAQQVESDELCHFFVGRLFNFRSLLDAGWSHEFLKRVADGFKKTYNTKRHDKSKFAFATLREILRFIASSSDPSCRTVQYRLNTGSARSVNARDWALATQSYSTWIEDRDDLKGGTSKTKLGAASSVLRHLGNAGVFPELEMALRAKGAASSHRRTLAEAPSTAGVDDYLAFATTMLHEAAKIRQIDIDTTDEVGFLQTLRAELSVLDRKAGDTPAEVIKRVLKRRLKAIEDALATVYVRWRRHWERGQELLEAGESLGDDWKDILFAGSRNEHVRRAEMRAFFPLDDRDRAIANLIRLVSDKLDGVYPRSADENEIFGQFFAKRALEYGGSVALQAMITPHRDAIHAVILLYLCSSGANVAVGRTLFVAAMEQSQISGATHVTGEKARAGGKPIHAHLDSRSHAVMGMSWLLDASSCVRERLELDDQSLLFVVDERSGFKPVEEYNLRSFLKRIVSGIPEIAELGVTPAMLRPTVLLIAALEGDANAHSAAALGQHTLNVGLGYTDRPPTRYMHDESIRAFVDSFQIASFHEDQDVTEWLGYTSADIANKLGDIMETGLGTLCRDLHGRPGNDGGKCKTFDCWKSCPQLVVIARKKDLALLIIWKASLVGAEAEWILERPERWYSVWFPWLEFIYAVERRILQTVMGKVWREATVLAAEIMAHPNFKPRRPF